jgi:Mg2+ and Co2+ transporter CorA
MSENKTVKTLKMLGKIFGLVTALAGLFAQNTPAILYGAFIFFANTKLGD